MDLKRMIPGRYMDQWTDFYDVSLESLGAHLIFGEVNENSMREAVTFLLKANKFFSDRELSLFINTVGGTCADGFALIDILEMSKLPVKTIGLGNVMSMGVLILASGTKGHRIITRNTMIMAHQFSAGTYGKFHEVMADLRAELMLQKQFIEHFKRNSYMDEKTIRDIMFGKSDEYLTPSECKKLGLCDQVVDELPEFSLEVPPLRPQRKASRAPSSRAKNQVPEHNEGTETQKKR
jgi:ATP-dependent Clp endopeptidase proteolytic subunit ClpP